jgi:hypothetical protein
LTAQNVAYAVRRVADFAFVGDTEQYAASRCVFAAKFGEGKRKMDPKRDHPRSTKTSKGRSKLLELCAAGAPPDYDAVYRAAEVRFALDKLTEGC